MTKIYHQTTDNLITKRKFHLSMQNFWPLGGEIPILNVICALAPNSVFAARFLYVENIVISNIELKYLK
jgi:hypothetical protein